MITGLDHLVLLARDIENATRVYETLLGVQPAWRTIGGGVATTIFTLANTSLEIMAPTGDGPAADRVKARLEADGEGLASLAFRVRDIDAYQRRLKRVGLDPEDIISSGSTNAIDGAKLNWRRTRTNVDATSHVRLFFLDMAQERPRSERSKDALVAGLDHAVIATPNPDRAAALYGARLGLDMKLDVTLADANLRLMFFACGDVTIEVVHHLHEAPHDDRDRVWGLSWRVANINAAHARLAGAGLDVSGIRAGRRPGTRAFTVHTGAVGVKTLIVQPAS